MAPSSFMADVHLGITAIFIFLICCIAESGMNSARSTDFDCVLVFVCRSAQCDTDGQREDCDG